MSDRDIVERLEEIATCSKTPLVEGIEVLHIAQTLEDLGVISRLLLPSYTLIKCELLFLGVSRTST